MRELQKGEHLAGYIIEKVVGRGGAATVYLARDQQGRAIAIKVLTQFSELERFQREATQIQKLQHPNIVQIYSWGRERDYYYIIMEYAPYRSLDFYLKTGQRFKPKLALDIVLQIARGLDYAHQHRVIHRDIKPNNILLDRQNKTMRAFITDFGIARVEDGQALTRHGELVGTPEYMSPEQARGRSADVRSEVYSLGLLLYYMLAGQPPIQADTPLVALHKQVYETPSSIKNIPSALNKVVFRAIDKEPRKRYQNMVQMIEALEAVRIETVSGPVKRKESTASATPSSTTVSQSNYWIIIGAVAVAMAVIAAFILLPPSRSNSSVVTTFPTDTPTALPATPTATRTPLPTSTSTPIIITTKPLTPTSTVVLTATATISVTQLSLTYPENDNVWTGLDTDETLRWSSSRTLADNEIFVITVFYKKRGVEHQLTAQDCLTAASFPIKEFYWLINPDNPAADGTHFEWTVQVMEKSSDDCEEIVNDGSVLSQARERRRFEWVP